MKRAPLFALLTFGSLLLSPRLLAQKQVVVLTYSGAISPAAAEYIVRGITEAEQRHAAAVVLQLDTPGGLDSAMRKIIQREMQDDRVPFIAFVAPAGARAASAGCLIVLAADIAAMAPGTNIGAAHPVYVSGSAVSEKIVNDSAAYARAIASARGHNPAWAERAVRESVSITSTEALDLHVIDLTAANLTDLLSKLDGRTANTSTGPVKMAVAGANIENIEMGMREKLLGALTDPTVAYLLLLLGILAVVIEITAPHGFVTGTIGVISVLVALVGLVNLPVQISGIGLLLLGMILLGLELKITSHGVLTLVGLVAFVFGSILLLPRIPGYRISPIAIGVVAVVWAGMLGAVIRLVLRARHAPVLTGTQNVAGRTGIAKTDLAPRGVVNINGEDWNALADAPPISRGERIAVVSVEGLTVHVRKAS